MYVITCIRISHSAGAYVIISAAAENASYYIIIFVH